MNVSPEVIQLVASNIGNDWKRLADTLELKCSLKRPLHRSNERNMLKSLQKRNIIWHELKKGLEVVNRGDIIQQIYDDFNLDSGKVNLKLQRVLLHIFYLLT